jgi:hypothetical protein
MAARWTSSAKVGGHETPQAAGNTCDTGTRAILASALVGRPLGITGASALARAAGFHLPHRIGWRELLIVAWAASAAFTAASSASRRLRRSPRTSREEENRHELLLLSYQGVFDVLAFSYEKGTVLAGMNRRCGPVFGSGDVLCSTHHRSTR